MDKQFAWIFPKLIHNHNKTWYNIHGFFTQLAEQFGKSSHEILSNESYPTLFSSHKLTNV